MTSTAAVFTERRGRVGYLVLNRPEKRNAISAALKDAADAAITELLADDEIRVIVVRGEGKSFCSGNDLSPDESIGTNSSKTRTSAQGMHWVLGEVATWRRLWECAKPTIAQVHGHCVAGGLMIAMECDLVVAADDALFGQPEARAIGLAPDHGLWPLTAGIRHTKEMLFTARLVTGTEAAEMGMINRSVPAGRVHDEVFELASEIAKTSTEMLTIQKASANAAAEAMGMSGMRESAVAYDVLAQASKVARSFRKVVREQGVKRALNLMNEGLLDSDGPQPSL
jgi:enoyl-CoA hydratase